MEGNVVHSGTATIMLIGGDGGRSSDDYVDLAASPRDASVPFLIDGPAEHHKQPAPRCSRAVQVTNPNLDVMHPNCHVIIVP